MAAAGIAESAQGANLTASITQNPGIGNVVAATSGDTVFKFDTSGAVSKVSGNGVRTSTGAGKSGIVTFTCTASSCNSGSVSIKIIAGAASGRGGVLTSFTASALGVTGGPGTTVTLTLPHGFGGTGSHSTSVAVSVGANFPIKGDTSNGSASASSSFTATATDGAGDTASASPVATANVSHGLSMTTTTLDFGRIVSSAIGGDVNYPAGTNVLSVPSDSAALGTHSLGSVTITGEPNAAVSIGVGAGALKNGGVTLGTITPTVSPGGSQFLVLNGNGTGSKTFKIGGKFTLPAGAAAGTYQGTMQVTAQYN